MNVELTGPAEFVRGAMKRWVLLGVMRPGDLVKLNNQGNWTRVVPDMHPRPLEMVIDYPPGTVALLLEVHIADNRDGPSMESYAKVFVNGHAGFVWLYACEEIRETR